MKLQVNILSPLRPFCEVEASSVLAPSSSGDVEVGLNHAFYVTTLKPGIVSVKGEEGVDFFVSGGILSVQNNVVRIFSDVIEGVRDLDKARAEKAERRALERLKSRSDLDLDINRALDSLSRAQARLKLLSLKNK
jgi:F-type H+-transporting ATPase subunit epsilon